MEYIVDILRENDEGLGIAKIDNMTAFVKNSIKGEKVKVQVIETQKNFLLAETTEIIDKSNARVAPICPYYNICGGCDIMHMNHDKQLDFKLNRVRHIFEKLYDKEVNIEKIESLNSFNYRNKVVLRVKNNVLGFYKQKTNELFECQSCVVSSDNINKVIQIIREFINNNKIHNINEVMIRQSNTNKVMISIDNINNNLKKSFLNELSKYDFISSIYINNYLEYGLDKILVNCCGLNFEVSPKSFFQVNYQVAEKLYNYVLDNIEETRYALDLYCGTGTITSIISKKCNKVIGIEIIKEAVEDANKSKELNNIKNLEFICGKVEDLIDNINIKDLDLLVMDPPRSGSDRKTLKFICSILPKKIIYISCNPVTLVRDLKQLDTYYDIKNIKLFDMFPQTHHVECVALLSLKNSVK